MSSPIIFEKGTRDFSTLGLGLLSDAIQATTTEELNGQFIFEMDYPVSGNNADLIKENRIIVVNSGNILKRQGFIIRQIVRKIDLTMTVYAEHVSYATLDVALAPIGTISGDAKTALENWKRMLVPGVDFTVDSDILTTNSTSIGAPEFETARQGLGGHAGSILDVWGGEYQFDNWHIRLLKQRGKSANAIIAYGRNLISFEQDTNIADTYTSVYPYYQENSGDDGNKTHFLPERTVDSEFVGKYPNPKVLMLDLSNKFKDVADYSETKLRNYALSYIQSNNIGVPKVNMKISTVDLSRATGGFSEDIDLGDTVNVYFEKLGITTSAKVIKAVWNVLSDDYDKFEIGARRASLTESISELATTADENANKALNQALVALQSADGKTTIYYLNSSDPWPTNPKENDTAFAKDGENSIMYRYMFNNDTGMFSWVKILDSMSADQIKQRVSDALESGKAYSDKLVADNVAQVNTVLSDVQAKQADLTAQQAELDTKAKGYADKALADAKANTQATAQQTAKDAQEYTDTAKAEAISVATTADGVINKKIDDTASSITSTINQNKADSDGKITTAQSTATQALDGLTQKVSQNIYDAKVNELTGKVSTAQQTADGAVTTIGNYKQSNDGRVASAESSIQQNASAITQKVSQTDYNAKTGELSGQISQVSQTAGQISQSVSYVRAQVDGLSVGGRNLILGTATDTAWSANSADNYSFKVIATGLKPGQTYTFSAEVTLGNTDQKITTVSLYDAPISQWLDSTDHFKADGTRDHWTFTVPRTVDTPTASLIIYAGTPGSTGGKSATYHHIKLEQGNLPTDWTPAPEDVDNKISTVSLTVDGISSIVSDPTTGLTKRVQTAEGTLSQVTGADIPALQKATYWQAPNGYDLNTYLTQGSTFFRDTTARTNAPTTSTKWMYLVVERTPNGDRVTQTAWYDTQTDAKITYRRQYAGTWGAWYANDNDSVATIAQTNGAIQTEISDRQKGDTNTLTQSKDFTTSSISNSESGMRSQITQTSDAILAQVSNTGVRYVRINGQGNQDNSGTHFMRVSLFDSSGKDLLLGKTATVSGPNSPYFGGNNGGNGATDGNVNTYSAIYPEPNANNFMVYDLGAVTYTSQKFEVKMWTNYRTYKGVTIQVSPDNKSWRTILQEDVKSVSGDITKPDTTVNLGNTSSATQLALLKDNWSIGITGNTNKLASGIAADPSAMAIVSPKVIIDSPQTQITGTAWIKTAMIADGQISTAKIGDASITSAKIANLDVSKITGNVTNFIQSNWNGVYGSTTITNNGMQISTSDVITTFGPYGIKLNEGGESVGGIGVSSYKDMPANFQGISFRLDGTGDYMTWSARESGVTTGDYSAKLSWFRSSYKPTGQNAGFNFSDDSPVTFWGDIYGREHTEPLKIASFNMQGVSAGGLGHGNGSSAITFGGDGETYIISSGTYYRLTRLVKALQPLIGLGTWSAPRNINSNGVVTQWTNITT